MPTTFIDDIEEMIPALGRFAQSLARNAADAADLVQDTLERALSRSHQYQEGTNLKAWLFTIMRNRFYTVCRHAALTRQHAEGHRVGADPADHVTVGDQMSRIESCEFALAFGKLTAGERALLILATVEEMPYETIARMLEVEVGTIKSRVSRIRAKLRGIQDSRGEVALARAGRPPLQARSRPGCVTHHAAPA